MKRIAIQGELVRSRVKIICVVQDLFCGPLCRSPISMAKLFLGDGLVRAGMGILGEAGPDGAVP